MLLSFYFVFLKLFTIFLTQNFFNVIVFTLSILVFEEFRLVIPRRAGLTHITGVNSCCTNGGNTRINIHRGMPEDSLCRPGLTSRFKPLFFRLSFCSLPFPRQPCSSLSSLGSFFFFLPLSSVLSNYLFSPPLSRDPFLLFLSSLSPLLHTPFTSPSLPLFLTPFSSPISHLFSSSPPFFTNTKTKQNKNKIISIIIIIRLEY